MQSTSFTSRRTVAVLPGDGVGPEVVEQALAVLTAACDHLPISVDLHHHHVGGAAIEAEGAPVSLATVDACRAADAVLLGATGGPRWDHLRGEARPGFGLLRLRQDLGLFANIRPVAVHPALIARTPFRDEVIRGADLVIVRELTGGAYYGEHARTGTGATERASDAMSYSRAEIERVARVAFELARTRRHLVTSVDKAGVLWSGRLWRDVVTEIAAEYPDVRVEHQLVDSFAARLIEAPRELDVVLTENLFGDILSDEAAVLCGSLGMLPSASIGAGGPGLYEPAHGSAPGLAGQGLANPLAAILSVAMMLEHSLGAPEAARRVRHAVSDVIAAGVLTRDLGGRNTTAETGAAVVAALADRARVASAAGPPIAVGGEVAR